MLLPILFHVTKLWIILNQFFQQIHSVCTPEYGPNPNPATFCNNKFLPAPPGKTPSCARPGFTYCEHPEHYPGELIYQLIQRWKFDHKTLIINEAKEEFSAVYFPHLSTVYGPPSSHPSTTFLQNHVQTASHPTSFGYHYPDPNYFVPKSPSSSASASVDPSGFYHLTPSTNSLPQHHHFSIQNLTFPHINPYYTSDYSTTTNNKDGTFLTYKYTSNFPHHNDAPIFAPPTYTHINDIWKRNERLKRSLKKYRQNNYLANNNDEMRNFNNGTLIMFKKKRKKRQSTVTGQTLCRSRSNYIMPKAALNSKGNWMYVVNMPEETTQQYTQLVKSEMCADTNCNGLCQLPQGYSSKCEQKYVQKRLIALEGSGNDLYSDTFWFPSCCICTISNN